MSNKKNDMKRIRHIPLDNAHVLTAAEMNRLHFDTNHTKLPPKEPTPKTDGSVSIRVDTGNDIE